MRIAVIGSGAIGGLVAGYLKQAGEDVVLVGRSSSVEAIRKNGLNISGPRGSFNIKIDVFEKLGQKVDLAILAAKTQDLEDSIKSNLEFIREALILTAQNGIRADNIASRYINKTSIISSIVMFGSTSVKPAEIVHNFEGSWVIGKAFSRNDDEVIQIGAVLNNIFPTIVVEDIMGMKYLKIFVNANNCIAAILGASMQEAFSDIEISKISIGIWKEGMEAIKKAGVELVSLPDFPLERLNKLVAMPTTDAAKIFSGIMANLSKEPLYGSILQSIKKGRKSEIDYINGEFVNIAKNSSTDAPLNKKLVEMVHKVEETGKFFSKEELLSHTKGLYN